MLTIKGVAQLVGLSTSTVRAWESRYQIVHPRRSTAGYRLYSDADVQVLREMKRLIDLGLSASAAAEHTRELHAVGEDLVRAAAAFDHARALRLFEERLAWGSFEAVVDTWLLPALVRLGEAWARGEVDVASEHAIAGALQRRLSAAFDAAGADNGEGIDVLTGLPAGSHHELGMLAFATCLRRCGVRVLHLGTDLPAAQWTRACEVHSPALAVLGAPMHRDADAVAETATRLAPLGVEVAVGGSYQQDVAALRPEVVLLGHSVPVAAARVGDLIRERQVRTIDCVKGRLGAL
ncbi:MAG: MerR family transcriptional regulator [Propionibacteriaceae bacterium]|nr:MerR family transcriptional regulator [Propionibacteriaceae bacterium]